MKQKINLIAYESNLWEKGYNFVCGIDEVGRGCIAGPLVVAAVILPKNYLNNSINDSKKIPPHKRKELAQLIKKAAIAYQIETIEPELVDKLNPKQASIFGMELCIKNIKIKPDFILTDYEKINTKIEQINIVKGDQKSQTIAAASILAKVYRDELMESIANNYDLAYDLKNNKGYLTKKHLLAIKNIGPIKNLHRFSYRPIKK